MSRALAILALAACSRSEPKPQVAPPPPAPKLAGCALATAAPLVPHRVSGYGVGGCGGHHRRTTYVPQISLGQPAVTGLDPAIFRRYVKRNFQKLLYCYERQLLAEPTLGGTVTIETEIGPDGVVAKASVNGVSPVISECMSDVVAHIEFPKPKANKATAKISLELSTPGVVSTTSGSGSATTERHAPWTPFALGDLAPPEHADAIVASASAAVTAREHDLAACWGAARGSLRALLLVGPSGSVTVSRAGGLGDATVEACVANALRAIHVDTTRAVELACDFSMGEPSPWRVTREPGWLEVDVTKDGAHLAGETQPLESATSDYLTAHTHDAAGALVIADRDAPGSAIAKAAALVNGLPVVTVAVRDDAAAPQLVALGHSDLTHRDTEVEEPRGLVLEAAGVRACKGATTTRGKIDDPAALGSLACSGASCASITLSLEGGTGADLLALAAGARRAKLDRIVIENAACPADVR